MGLPLCYAASRFHRGYNRTVEKKLSADVPAAVSTTRDAWRSGCNRAATADESCLSNTNIARPDKTRGRERKGMRVLVVEDDEQVAEGIALGLRRAGMAVDVVFDGTAEPVRYPV